MKTINAVIISVLIFFLILGVMWLIDDYLEQKMSEVCTNLSMTYLYKEVGSFYCFSTINGTIQIKEIKYK